MLIVKALAVIALAVALAVLANAIITGDRVAVEDGE